MDSIVSNQSLQNSARRRLSTNIAFQTSRAFHHTILMTNCPRKALAMMCGTRSLMVSRDLQPSESFLPSTIPSTHPTRALFMSCVTLHGQSSRMCLTTSSLLLHSTEYLSIKDSLSTISTWSMLRAAPNWSSSGSQTTLRSKAISSTR